MQNDLSSIQSKAVTEFFSEYQLEDVYEFLDIAYQAMLDCDVVVPSEGFSQLRDLKLLLKQLKPESPGLVTNNQAN